MRQRTAIQCIEFTPERRRYVAKKVEKQMVENSNFPIDLEVAAVFNSYPQKIKTKLMFLRQLIFDTAESIEGIGEIEETLKWGEPSYLTPESKSGSTIRIAWKKSKEEQYSIFFKCTANLVPAFKEKYPKIFKYGGNRSIDFKINDQVPVKELKRCIALALTYHRNKKLENPDRWEMVENLHNNGSKTDQPRSRQLNGGIMHKVRKTNE